MRILFVSQAYPPYPIVGALRARRVAEMFRDRGHEVTVVTERLEGEKGEVRLEEEHLTVRTVSAGLPYRLRLVAFRNRLRGRSVALSSWDGPNTDRSRAISGVNPRRLSVWLRAFKRFVIDLLRLPDDQQHFVLPALRISRQLVHTGIDLVYTTAPAFSTHLVGLLLRRRRKVLWVAEFRDPWIVEHPQRGREAPAWAILRLNRWMERQCLRHADVIVVVTQSVGRAIAAKLPADKRGKIVVAMNGIDGLESPRVPTSRSACYRIVHTGSFYHDRDPRPFLSALAEWMHESCLGPNDVQVDFAGRCRHYADVSVEHIVRSLGLGDVVRFHDWLPHDAVRQMLREADLVLLFARSQPAQVPNKLFDYLGARTPILGVVDEGGESANILARVGGQYVITTCDGEPVNVAEIREALERAYSQRCDPIATNEIALEALLSSRQLTHLADAIGA